LKRAIKTRDGTTAKEDEPTMRILAGDIGGTNTRLSLWTRDGDAAPVPIGEPSKYKNAGFPSLDAILDRYLADAAINRDGVTDACFGIAGPVDGRQVRLTNIAHWPVVNADTIAEKLAIADTKRVNLINDMPAHAASLGSITDASKITVINYGEGRPTGAEAIVMPGTGLGIGMLAWDARNHLHRPLPTEGGHQDLPARGAETLALIASMRLLFPATTITREHALSGPGLRAIYACLRDPDAPTLDGVPTADTFLSIEATDPLAKRSLDLFAKLLGELCGNVAFGYLATGGVFLAGNIVTTLKSRLMTRTFLDAFLASGPPALKTLITSVPVKLVTYADTGLLGAATYATWAAEGRL
jgi:glucokinase